MDPRRSQRVVESIREELSELVSYEMSDPRVGDATIIDVQISPDGKKAIVRVAASGDAEQRAEAIAALNNAKPFLRAQLGSRLSLFRVPDLKFEEDVSADLAAKLPHLMRRIRRGRPRDGQGEETPSE